MVILGKEIFSLSLYNNDVDNSIIASAPSSKAHYNWCIIIYGD